MELGVTLRNMGPQSTADIMQAGALHAESLGFDSIWITDHPAIPPDDAEGSGGRYTDPLTTLAWLGGLTSKLLLGVGVLIVPYREALATATAIATVHELTGHRLLLGAAVGWMDAEFRAFGIDRHQRGRITDDTLAFWSECFANHVVEHNGQPLIFSPRPPAPPVYIGGAAPHALKRALRFDHGWLPMARHPEQLAQDLTLYAEMAREAGKPMGPVTVMSGVPLRDEGEARARIQQFSDLGVERLVCTVRYDTLKEYQQTLDALARLA